ncbi:MAG: transporter substrate-binding domain-containing protein [Aquimonas sp.]|nr:transporter substrate-binding domain-containing protein [Aquimonas sp.]
MLPSLRPQGIAESPRILGSSLLLVALALVLLAIAWPPLGPVNSLQARLAAGHSLRVGYALEPPYAFVDEAGVLRGESVEVLDAVLGELGIRTRSHVRLDFGSLIEELEAGRIDLIAGGLFVTPERSLRVRFTHPTAEVAGALAVRLDRSGEGKLAVLHGSVESDHADLLGYPKQRVLALPDARTAMAALAVGEVEAFALSAPSLRWLATHADAAGHYHVLPQPTLPVGRPAFAVRPDDAWLAERIDRVLVTLIGSPRHLALVAPYGFGPEELPPARASGAANEPRR